MSIGIAELHEGMVSAWNDSTLNDSFRQYWSSVDVSRYPVLQEEGGLAPQTPFPHASFEQGDDFVLTRMTKTNNSIWALHQTLWTFKIQAKELASGNKTAKELSHDLMQLVLMVFGGHPTQAPTAQICLDNGSLVTLQTPTFRSFRNTVDVHVWQIMYPAIFELPVKVR